MTFLGKIASKAKQAVEDAKAEGGIIDKAKQAVEDAKAEGGVIDKAKQAIEGARDEGGLIDKASQSVRQAVSVVSEREESSVERIQDEASPLVPRQNHSSRKSIIEDYDQYAKYTSDQDWESIFKANGVAVAKFGTKKELKVLANYLEEDEVVFALTSGIMKQSQASNNSDAGHNTWLVVLTNERFLFLDHALLTKSVDTKTVRLEHVRSVSASQGFILGKISVDSGNPFVVDNCPKETVSVIADLANKWIRVLKKREKSEQTDSQQKQGETVLDKLEKLNKLKSVGAINEDEYLLHKEKLLEQL